MSIKKVLVGLAVLAGSMWFMFYGIKILGALLIGFPVSEIVFW